MASRKSLDLTAELQALRRLQLKRIADIEARELPTLPPDKQLELEGFQSIESMADLEKAQKAFGELSLDVRFYLTQLGKRTVVKAPYYFSDLPTWLNLETWKPKDALLLLSGISPNAAKVDWTYENFMGVQIEYPRIKAATDLTSVDDVYDIPERDAWDDDIRATESHIKSKGDAMAAEERSLFEFELQRLKGYRDTPVIKERAEELHHRSNILAALSRQWFSGDHDAEKRYSPEHYLGWAAARGYEPEWYDWALSQGLIDAHEGVYRQPFFDPDSPDYPELLHIAVNAWQEARKGGVGTPKQRIERFLQERYSAVPPTTREMIAQLVNWHRTGGRPKS